MNAMLEFTSGRCTNEMFCAVASAGDVVRVPVGARFVCSYCGGKLVESAAKPRRIGLRGGAVIGGGMGLTGIGLFVVGALLGSPPATAHATANPTPISVSETSAPAAMRDVASAAPALKPEHHEAPTAR